MLTSMVAHTVGQIQEDSCELSSKARAMTAGSHSGKGALTQSGNFRIFLSFIFYVKSILENPEVLKMLFLPFLGL